MGAGLERLTKECLGLPDRQRRGCFHGLGKLYQWKVAKNPYLLGRVCHNGSQEDQIVCIEGAIEKLADFNYQKAIRACLSLIGKNLEVCAAAAKNKMYRLNKPSMAYYL